MTFTKPTWKITVRACVAASLGPGFGKLLGVLGRAGSPLGTSGDPWPCMEQALLPAVGLGTSFPMGGDRSLPVWCGTVWLGCPACCLPHPDVAPQGSEAAALRWTQPG